MMQCLQVFCYKVPEKKQAETTKTNDIADNRQLDDVVLQFIINTTVLLSGPSPIYTYILFSTACREKKQYLLIFVRVITSIDSSRFYLFFSVGMTLPQYHFTIFELQILMDANKSPVHWISTCFTHNFQSIEVSLCFVLTFTFYRSICLMNWTVWNRTMRSCSTTYKPCLLKMNNYSSNEQLCLQQQRHHCKYILCGFFWLGIYEYMLLRMVFCWSIICFWAHKLNWNVISCQFYALNRVLLIL